MLLGVISDTHGNIANAAKAVERLKCHDIDMLIHCGDIGSPSVLAEFDFELTGWPTHFVFGNVDSDEALLRHAITDAGQTCHHRFADLDIAGKRIAVIHSDDYKKFREVIESGEFDLVCYGHTHKPESHAEGKTLVLNPGALHRANPHTLAIVDLEMMAVTHLPLIETMT